MLGFPAQLAPEGLAAGHEHGRVSWTSWADLDRDGMASDLAGRVDDLFDREALSVAQVVGAATAVQRAQSKDMTLGQVQDMDVVPHAGAVGGRVVIAEDCQRWSPPGGSAERVTFTGTGQALQKTKIPSEVAGSESASASSSCT